MSDLMMWSLVAMGLSAAVTLGLLVLRWTRDDRRRAIASIDSLLVLVLTGAWTLLAYVLERTVL